MIHILFAGNRGVFDGILTCALSILRRTATREPFCFHILTMDLTRLRPEYRPISNAQVTLLRRVVRDHHPGNEVHLTDVTALYTRELAGCPNESAYCSPYTLIRLLADLVEAMPDKLLYLDADVLFHRDICLLYNMDITGYEYAAAPDHYGKYLIRPGYINAGVLLLDLSMIRQTGLFEKARQQLRDRKLPFADQSALIRATTRRRLLPQRFNDQKFLHGHTVVRHFSRRMFWLPYPHIENVKPWQTDRIHKLFSDRYHCFDDILSQYASLIRTLPPKEDTPWMT